LTKPPPQHLQVTSSTAYSACVVAGNPLREAKNPYEDKEADGKIDEIFATEKTPRDEEFLIR